MNQLVRERVVYEPISMGVKPMGPPIPPVRNRSSVPIRPRAKGFSRPRPFVRSKPPQSSRPRTVALPISKAPESFPLKRIPPVIASLALLVLLASGALDSFVTEVRNPQSLVFPGESPVITTVQKASLESSPRPAPAPDAVFTKHRIAKGETLSRIAYNYGLSPATLISVNRLQRPDDAKVDKELIIPYRDGIRVPARGSESIRDAAGRFAVDRDAIQVLPNGDFFIGGDILDEVPLSFAEDMFRYPVAGRVLNAYGTGVDDITGIPFKSEGIDLEADSGIGVAASREGRVILTGHHSSYGLYVIMDHSGGWRSFYGHLGRIDVAPGDRLAPGTLLGIAGQSGTARSPRVHFVLIRNGETVDPLDYLY